MTRKRDRNYKLPNPPTFFLMRMMAEQDKGGLTIQDWEATPLSVRSEIVRACDELNAGIAIQKDKCLGRAKRDPNGFYGLHVAERDGAADLEERRARGKRDEDILRQNEEIADTFGAMAKGAGQSLREWIKERVDLEQTIRGDPVVGIFKVCDLIGVDPLAIFSRVLATEAVH